MIRFENDLARAIEGMNRLERRQVPFALSRALNATAFEVRKHIVERVWPASVTARNKRFAAVAIRVTKKARKGDLAVEIADRLGRGDIFARQAEGGTRRPASGRHLAVPKIRRNAGGSIPKAMRPRAVLAKDGYFKNHAGNAILRRMKNGKLKVVYLLVPSARIERRFPAYDEAVIAFERAMPNAFDKAIDEAFRTMI